MAFDLPNDDSTQKQARIFFNRSFLFYVFVFLPCSYSHYVASFLLILKPMPYCPLGCSL